MPERRSVKRRIYERKRPITSSSTLKKIDIRDVEMASPLELKKKGSRAVKGKGKEKQESMGSLKLLADIACNGEDDPSSPMQDETDIKVKVSTNGKRQLSEMSEAAASMSKVSIEGHDRYAAYPFSASKNGIFCGVAEIDRNLDGILRPFTPFAHGYLPPGSEYSFAEDRGSKLGPGQHMRQDKHRACIERARAVKRDKPSKEMFKDALLQMEEHRIVELTRSPNLEIGIHGISFVVVKKPDEFANRIWHNESHPPDIVTFFPPGYKSEAKKPKNTFIAQWDRKGFEHSYSIADDLKISSASADGRPGPVDFRIDIRYRRVVAFLSDVCFALMAVSYTINPQRFPSSPHGPSRRDVDVRLNLKVNKPFSQGWFAVRCLFDFIIEEVTFLQSCFRATRAGETKSKWGVLQRAIDACSTDDAAAAAGEPVSSGGSVGGRHPRAQGAYCEALKFVLDRISELCTEFSVRPPPVVASPAAAAQNLALGYLSCPPGAEGLATSGALAVVGPLEELRRRVESEVGAEASQQYPTMYVWTAEQWRKKKPESESARKKRKAAEAAEAADGEEQQKLNAVRAVFSTTLQPPPQSLVTPVSGGAAGGGKVSVSSSATVSEASTRENSSNSSAASAASTREGSRHNSAEEASASAAAGAAAAPMVTAAPVVTAFARPVPTVEAFGAATPSGFVPSTLYPSGGHKVPLPAKSGAAGVVTGPVPLGMQMVTGEVVPRPQLMGPSPPVIMGFVAGPGGMGAAYAVPAAAVAVDTAIVGAMKGVSPWLSTAGGGSGREMSPQQQPRPAGAGVIPAGT